MSYLANIKWLALFVILVLICMIYTFNFGQLPLNFLKLKCFGNSPAWLVVVKFNYARRSYLMSLAI